MAKTFSPSARHRADWERAKDEHRRVLMREGLTEAEFEAMWPDIRARLVAERLDERQRNTFRARI